MATVLIDDKTKEGKDLIEFLRKNKSAHILDEAQEKDWWTLISEREKEAIIEGLSDIESGKTISYDKISERFRRIK